MEAIELTRGKFALIDEADLEKVSIGSWCASPSGKTWFAMHSMSVGGRVRPQTMHRLIMDAPTDMDVHHINGNGLDNRRSNLQLCTRSETTARAGRAGSKFNAVKAAMAKIDERQGYVTIKEIIFQSGGVSERTVRTYMKELVDSGEWAKLPISFIGKRGRGCPETLYHRSNPS